MVAPDPTIAGSLDRDRSADLQSVADRDRLGGLLTEAEQRLAEVPELRRRIAALEAELADATRVAELARLEAQQLDQMLMYGRRMLRYVRPAIKPLRDARRRLRSR